MGKSLNAQNMLPLLDTRPILDVLMTVSVATWKDEGLFRQSRITTKYDGIINVSVGKKIQFVQNLISKWYEMPARNINAIRSEPGTGLSKQMIMAERHDEIKKLFFKIQNKEFAADIVKFILAQKPVQARYFAKKIGMRWPEFVIEFNSALVDMLMEN